jgi:hypothetical protein
LGTFCGFSGALTLKNRGVAFATGALDFDTECKKCPDSVKWKLTGTFTVNTLNATGIPDHGFGLYLSDNAALDANDLKLTKKAIGLSTLTKAFNDGKPVKLKAKVPSGTDLTGKFLILAEDDDDVVDESNESNNTIVFGPLQ